MSEEDKYVPFKERPEWADVKPRPQDDGPEGGVCVIAYSDQFRETMDYFRSVVHSDEKSERVLKLTEEVIQLNAANYTAWYFRRKVLEALGSDIKKELDWTSDVAEENPKNYQIWYHRRALLERSKDITGEMEFTAQMLKDDSKNYHAWAHRQWILEAFPNLWEAELRFIDEMLNDDLRNNSAWNQRYFVLSRTRNIKDPELIKEEIDFAFKYISRAPNNQSPWNYLKGIVRGGGRFADVPGLRARCEEFRERFPTCANVVSLLIDMWEEDGSAEALQKASEGCETMKNSLAQTHNRYWDHRLRLVSEKLPKSRFEEVAS